MSRTVVHPAFPHVKRVVANVREEKKWLAAGWLPEKVSAAKGAADKKDKE